MGTPTYTLIQEQVLGSATASVTFSSIPGTYKDLVLEMLVQQTGGDDVLIRFNADTGSNYSCTWLYGTGTTAGSSRNSTQTSMLVDAYGYAPTSNFSTNYIHVMSYVNSNVYKTCLIRPGSAATGTDAMVGLWRSSAAITSINLRYPSATFTTGSTFRLWGVA